MTAIAFILLLITTIFKALMNVGYVLEKRRYSMVYHNPDTQMYHTYQGIMHGVYFLAVNALVMDPTVIDLKFIGVLLMNTAAMHFLLSWIVFELIMYKMTGIELLYASPLNLMDKQFYKLPDVPKLITGVRTSSTALASGYKLISKIIVGVLAIYALIWL